MKILMLAEPNSPNTISWVSGLRELGCEVHIASARTDGEDGSYPIGPVGLPPRLRVLLGGKSVKKLIRELQPDILIAYRITSYGYLAARTGFHPLVLAAQNEQIAYLPYPSLLRKTLLEFFVRYAVRRADLIHAWGGNIRAGLLKYGAQDAQILVMHRGIDITKFQTEREDEVITDSPVFLSTRSLSPEYRIDLLIRGFQILLRAIPGAKLNIVGGGPERARLEAFTRERGMAESVTFLGRMPFDAVATELAKSDFYVSVIRTEGISSSLLEACLCGIVPIVENMAASREILVRDGVDYGILVDDPSPSELAQAMEIAVADSALQRRVADANPAYIKETFSRSTNMPAFVAQYRTLIDDQ